MVVRLNPHRTLPNTATWDGADFLVQDNLEYCLLCLDTFYSGWARTNDFPPGQGGCSNQLSYWVRLGQLISCMCLLIGLGCDGNPASRSSWFPPLFAEFVLSAHSNWRISASSFERLTVSFDGWNHLVPLSAWAILWVVRLNRIATFQHTMELRVGLEPTTCALLVQRDGFEPSSPPASGGLQVLPLH